MWNCIKEMQTTTTNQERTIGFSDSPNGATKSPSPLRDWRVRRPKCLASDTRPWPSRENGKPPLAAGMPIFIDKAWYQCGINVNIPLHYSIIPWFHVPLFIINIIFHYSINISLMFHIQLAGHLVYLGAVQHDLFADALGTAHHIVWRQVPGAALMPAAVASTNEEFVKKGVGRVWKPQQSKPNWSWSLLAKIECACPWGHF